MKFKITLPKNTYSIYLKWKYAGSIAQCRTPRPGENWLRGNDLHDGPLWQLPWVIWDIICYELEIRRWKKAAIDPPLITREPLKLHIFHEGELE